MYDVLEQHEQKNAKKDKGKSKQMQQESDRQKESVRLRYLFAVSTLQLTSVKSLEAKLAARLEKFTGLFPVLQFYAIDVFSDEQQQIGRILREKQKASQLLLLGKLRMRPLNRSTQVPLQKPSLRKANQTTGVQMASQAGSSGEQVCLSPV